MASATRCSWRADLGTTGVASAALFAALLPAAGLIQTLSRLDPGDGLTVLSLLHRRDRRALARPLPARGLLPQNSN